MDEDKKVVSIADHKVKIQKKETEDNRQTTAVVNPNLSPDVLEDIEACISHEDMEATLRVLSLLRTIGDDATIKVDQENIYITVNYDPDDDIDAGVDFPEQVVKMAGSYQAATINFDYKDEEWDSLENYIYNVGFSLRRCIESLSYWGTGDKDDA